MPASTSGVPPLPSHSDGRPGGGPTPIADGSFRTLLGAALGKSGAPGGSATRQAGITLGEMVDALAQESLRPGESTAVLAAGRGSDPLPGGPAPVSAAGPVIGAAERYLGVPYRWGGTDPRTGLDCSGFVQRVFADLGVKLPRVSADQSRAGTAVESLAEARPGDLVFWNGSAGRPNHIGIYAGNGQMIVAPKTGDVVRYQELRRDPPDAIRRVLP